MEQGYKERIMHGVGGSELGAHREFDWILVDVYYVQFSCHSIGRPSKSLPL